MIIAKYEYNYLENKLQQTIEMVLKNKFIKNDYKQLNEVLFFT